MISAPKASQIPPALRRFWPVLLLALLPLIPLFRVVFLGQAIGPFDQIRQMAPWNGPKASQPWDVLQADGVLQFYVWRDLVFDSWGKGQIPFWNPYQLAGTPLLANSQSGVLYPPHIILGVLHVPTGLAMALLAWFHLFWAGLGAYVLCRALGASKVGGTISGASFSLSSFMIAWTGLPSVIETVAWIPWVLAFVLFLFEKNPLLVRLATLDPNSGGEDVYKVVADSMAARRRYALYTIGLGFSIGMMILAGHLQFVAYGLMALALFVIWLLATRRRPFAANEVDIISVSGSGSQRVREETTGRAKAGLLFITNPKLGSTLRVAMGVILGFCIAAPQLLAVLQYSQFSHRKNTPTDKGYEAYVGGAIQPYELIKVLAPSIQGNPREVYDEKLPISTYYPALVKPGANFAESAIGLGFFAVILLGVLPLATKTRDAVWGILAIGGVGLLLALGSPLNKLLYFGVPGWSSTGSPGRAACLFVLAGCVGAGLAASRLSGLLAHAKQHPRPVAASGIGILVVIAACWFLRDGYDPEPRIAAMVISVRSLAESSAMPSVLGVALLSLLAIGLAIKEQTARSAALLLSVPILSCLAFFGANLIQSGNPKDLQVKNDLGMQRIATINRDWELLIAVNALLPPNTAALNRIHSLDGYDSLLHRGTVDLLRDIDGPDPVTHVKDPAAHVNGNMMLISPDADLKKLADAGVTQVWSTKAISALGTQPPVDGVYKYPLKGPGRASTPQGPAEILSESASQLRLKAVGPGKLVVRERNMPGWLPKVDGKHVAMSGTTWMELDLSPGEHRIELNYVAPGFRKGIFLAAPAWVIMFLLVFWRRKVSLPSPIPS